MGEEAGGETRTADLKLYGKKRTYYAPDILGAPVLNKLGDLREGFQDLMHKIRNPEIQISSEEYPKLVQAAQERSIIGDQTAMEAENLTPLVTAEELTMRDSEYRREITDMRANTLRMELFFNPVKMEADVVNNEQGKVVAFKNIRVQEPKELPSDQAVSRYFEAKRMHCQAEAERARVKHDMGNQGKMEGLEMKYRLAIDVLSGTGQRPDLIPELLREEAKYFLVKQTESNRLANKDPDPTNTAMHQRSRQLDGTVSYIERLAKSFEDRFGLKK